MPDNPARSFSLLASRFGLFLAVWLILTGGRPDGLPFGIAAALGATVILRAMAPAGERPLRLSRVMPLVPGFLKRSWQGSVDVAWRAFHPRMPLNVGWIVQSADLPAGTPRVILGGEMALLPGTLPAGTRGGRFLVHCLDVEQPVREQFCDEEKRIRRIVAP